MQIIRLDWLSTFICIFCIYYVSKICRSTFLTVVKESRVAVVGRWQCFGFKSDVTLCSGLQEQAGKWTLFIFKLHATQYLLPMFQDLTEQMLASKRTWMSFSVKRTKDHSRLRQPLVPTFLRPRCYWQISRHRGTP